MTDIFTAGTIMCGSNFLFLCNITKRIIDNAVVPKGVCSVVNGFLYRLKFRRKNITLCFFALLFSQLKSREMLFMIQWFLMTFSKEQVLSRIRKSGLVAVVRADSAEQAEKIAEALAAGGVAAIEITFTVPGADDVIQALATKYKFGEIIIGAGTVLDSETARIAILQGAQYIVSPCLNVETVKLCNRNGAQ